MKLSLQKKWGGGFVHVRAGAIVTVAHDHQVATSSYMPESHAEGSRRTFAPSERWMTAKVGDLAFELVAVATGKRVATSYLSGAAIGLMRYDDAPAPAHWFTPSVGWRVSFPREPLSAGMTQDQMYAAILRCKYAPPGVRVITFDLELPRTSDDPTGKHMLGYVSAWFQDAYTLGPDPTGEHSAPNKKVNDRLARSVIRSRIPDLGPFDPELARPTGHLIGFVHTDKKKTPGCYTLHCQPTGETDDYGATAFQVAALTTCRPVPSSLLPVDIFDHAYYERACGVTEGDCPHGWIQTTCTACRAAVATPAVAS
jgi:hypothetical protein